MKRKRGNKKGKSKKPSVGGVNDAAPSIDNLSAEDNFGLDDSDKDEFDSGMEAETPSSTGTDQPDKLASISSSKPIDKSPGNLVYGSVKVKIKTSKALDSQLTCSDAPTQSDTDMSIPQVGLEKQVVSEKMEDSANSLPEINRGVLGTQSKKAGSIKIKSRAFSSSSLSPCNNAGVAQGETIHQELLRRDPLHNKQQLNAALEVIKKIMEMDAAEPFNVPVNPIALGIPDYFDVIDTPMDFGTICSNLENGVKYMNSADVLKDVQYIWENCFKYNNKGDFILDLMKRVKKNFAKYWAAAGLYGEQTQGVTGTESIQATDVTPSSHGKMPLKGGQLKQKTRKRHGDLNGLSLQGVLAPELAKLTHLRTLIMSNEANVSNPHDGPDGSSLDTIITVEINQHNQVIGSEKGRFMSRLGKVVQAQVPISYTDWRKVPETYKEAVWKDMKRTYGLPESYKISCYKSMCSLLKTYKSTLRKSYYDKYSTDAERLANVPPGVKLEQWKEFLEHENTEEAKKKRKAGKDNRAKIGATHTSGRHGNAQVEYNMTKKLHKKPLRVDVWIASHTCKDGSVKESIVPIMDKVLAKKKELEESCSDNTNEPQSLRKDALSEVFGIDKRGRTRGVGSIVSLSSIEASAPSLSLLAAEKANGNQMKGRLDTLESEIKGMNNKLSNIETMIGMALRKSHSSPAVGASESNGTVASFNVESCSLEDGVSCDVLGFNGKVIGKGRIDATPRDAVHNHIVNYEKEVVLLVDKVLEENASLYLGTQGGAELLGDVGSGSWVVWPKSLVTRIVGSQ